MTTATLAPAAPADVPGMYQQIGTITRQLHDALRELGVMPKLQAAAGDLPDARSRLNYVATKTGEAAGRVLDCVEQDLKKAGFPPLAWYDALLELSRAPSGELRPVELERQMLLPQYSTSRLIDRLVDEGLAVRRECKMDKRGLFVEITDAGRDLQKRMWGAYSAAIERHVGSKLSDADAVKLSGLLDWLGCSCPGTGQTVTKEAASAR